MVAVDPPASSGRRAAACGIVAAGRAGDLIYVLADETVAGLSPARSPDRLDALVWAVAALSFGTKRGPRVRGL